MKGDLSFFFRALQRVQILVAEYETVKKQESERRATYKNEKNELEQEINQLEARLQSSSDLNPEENEKMKQIEEQYQLVADRLQKQRLILVNIIE
jgi:chromosome segregation ATPase